MTKPMIQAYQALHVEEDALRFALALLEAHPLSGDPMLCELIFAFKKMLGPTAYSLTVLPPKRKIA